jgi:hypothetical protein
MLGRVAHVVVENRLGKGQAQNSNRVDADVRIVPGLSRNYP